ncbi:Hypp594 [Branchiostoma lanceolatum]|uniref:Hypp594 protein n=1 Tax=Branchiostoma lanceolatum TaxID=7740 RepID=A0A8J9VF73_BRALA|nr:Hypp594 [Branchiostoma lanceolatum]
MRKRRSENGEKLQETAKKLNEATEDESSMAESSLLIDIKSIIESALQPIKDELQQVAKFCELKELRDELDRIS